MERTWLIPLLVLLLVGAYRTAGAGAATVYYYTPYKNWETYYLHHNAGGPWTTAPGERMTPACTHWMVKTVDFASMGGFDFVFSNGHGAWDNRGGKPGANYAAAEGVHQVKNGLVIFNAGSPCWGGQEDDDKHTSIVYYRPDSRWASTYIHYAVAGQAWTTPPGTVMDGACDGWKKKTIVLGGATTLNATFNDGAGRWDNNSGRNYSLGVGTVKVEDGRVAAGDPCSGAFTSPSVPTQFKLAARTTSTLTLRWNASIDDGTISAYEILFDETRTFTISGRQTSFTLGGLKADTSYTFRVRARDNDGHYSDYTAPLSVKTQPRQIKQAVVYYDVKSRGWSAVNIHYRPDGGSWTAPPGVRMDEAACNGWAKKTVALGSADGLTAAFNNNAGAWDNNQRRDYRLPVGLSTVKDGVVTSHTVSPCLPDKQPPTVPQNLKASLRGLTVELTWDASNDDRGIARYAIERTHGTPPLIRAFTASNTRYTDASVAADTLYTYRIAAVDTSGNRSSLSRPVTIKTGPGIEPGEGTFRWDNATVYFLMTDRFYNADPSNDRSYGRESDRQGRPFANDLTTMPAAFHGGDLKGLTRKIEEGYFTRLGINAVWFTAPYEQIHGFVSGDGAHKHYAYHGYYALDFTSIDKNMGSAADLQAMVDAAHAKGIRVVMDVVMNHVGYETLKDMDEFGFGGLNSGWESTAFKPTDDIVYSRDIEPYLDINDSKWSQWWDADWLRVSNRLNGYSPCNGTDGLTGCVGHLPDFRTDNDQPVVLPPLLLHKWAKEGRLEREQAELDAWFARTGRPRTVPNYLIKWLTDYVREYGIDGFRVDTIKHVELRHLNALKEEARRARRDWLAAHPDKAALLKGDIEFWMTGEHWGHGVERSAYFDNGFDSVVNFSFQRAAGNMQGIDATYNTLATVNADNSRPYNMLSYISSHDSGLFDRNRLSTGITTLLMAPGGVQLFYGDESRRPLLSCCGGHAARGDMNWSAIDTALLAHAQKLGRFRNAHVAIGSGSHVKLGDGPYTFARVKDSDRVVIAFEAQGRVALNVGGIFADGTALRDAYTGQRATVSAGRVDINADSSGVVLLEPVASGHPGTAP